MSLLHLEGIGKIYVSEGSVAVGIRHVTLDFDIGEFVAVTGKSGSGKTTLLNVLSGMDTYEEGELYIEGEPTSHYSQGDWELYRQQYISFIFQDYNIIDSFTVLQNVELALSDIEDKKERRARALALIDRVGLTAYRDHKGAKLSGGQKQRTVIARALAKDSPIILADEPTGNLDSRSSEEIVSLLAEIAREKLVIVVTHSFSQLERYATREVRIFDGRIERDVVLHDAEKKPLTQEQRAVARPRTLARSFELGVHRFAATPKLSAFLCMLMILAILGTFVITCFCTTDLQPIGKAHMFTPASGRLVLVRQDGTPLREDELSGLVDALGASAAVHYDALLDHGTYIGYIDEHGRYYHVSLNYTHHTDVAPEIGRRPEAADEVMLYLPIEFQPIYGKDTITRETLRLYSGAIELKVVGLAYYYDNTKDAGNIILSKEGFELLSAADYLCGGAWQLDTAFSLNYILQNADGTTSTRTIPYKRVAIDPSLTGRSFSLRQIEKELEGMLKEAASYTVGLFISATEHDYYYDSARTDTYQAENVTYLNADVTQAVTGTGIGVKEEIDPSYTHFGGNGNDIADVNMETMDLYISPALALEMMVALRNDTYTQASLLFESDARAQATIPALREAGYVAVLSTETYADADNILGGLLSNGLLLFVWLLLVFFLGIFMALCSTRAMTSKRGDLAILRSMGIPARVIGLSAYVQMFFAVIPAVLVLAGAATLCYLHPRINPILPFLHAPQYAMILLGILLIAFVVTYRYNKRMFRDSVRKTLKGGEAQ